MAHPTHPGRPKAQRQAARTQARETLQRIEIVSLDPQRVNLAVLRLPADTTMEAYEQVNTLGNYLRELGITVTIVVPSTWALEWIETAVAKGAIVAAPEPGVSNGDETVSPRLGVDGGREGIAYSLAPADRTGHHSRLSSAEGVFDDHAQPKTSSDAEPAREPTPLRRSRRRAAVS